MRPESLHVTLCFLAYHPEQAIPRIAELIALALGARRSSCASSPSRRRVPKGRPRLYAVGAVSEAAVALQAELAEALVAERFYEPEKRAFWPHVTVARVRSRAARRRSRGERRGKGRPRRVDEPPEPLPAALTEPFGAVRVALYRSDLKPQGAEYVSLAGVDLPSP